MEPGPNGEYLRGKPLREGESGGLKVAFHVVREKRVILIDFGTVVLWTASTDLVALQTAALFRSKVKEAFGDLPYDASTLPLKFKVNKEESFIETYFPYPIKVLIANPEVFLAWADKLEEAAKELSS